MRVRIRVGVIGTSGWAAFHLRSLKSHPRADVTAVCGRDRERAAELATKFDIPQVFTDWRAMLAGGQLDAAVILSPDDLHYPMTMAALDAGLHVLCEKPLAMSATQALEMYEKAEVAGVKHMTFFTNRWLPAHRYLRRLVEEEYVGRLVHCRIDILSSYARKPEYLWRMDGGRANGALGDIGAHAFDLARWYDGEIGAVCCDLAVHVQRPGPDGLPLDQANDSANLLLRFESGAQGVVELSSVVDSPDGSREIVLYGSDGTLELRSVAGQSILHAARSGDDHFETLAIPEGLLQGVDPANRDDVFLIQSAGGRQFIDAILDNAPIAATFYDGWKAQQIIDAALASHAESRWIRVSGD